MLNALAVTSYKLYGSHERPSMEGINEVISRLKFIGRIPVGEKLSVQSLQTQPDTWMTTISRSLNSRESRHETFRFFNTTVEEAFRIIDMYSKSSKKCDKNLCRDIMKDLEIAAKVGIRNIGSTYEYDSKYCCDIQVLIDSILRRLDEINIIDVSNDKE